ncbi:MULTISPECIES: hypothetical protein [Pseudomonas]|uniref:hypothetical protein n=1 Tax=Pseudomonas TaxID=286 RepID=UPI001F333248|nr:MULTISPECIES: hypothetical protein [Pseudomonas]
MHLGDRGRNSHINLPECGARLQLFCQLIKNRFHFLTGLALGRRKQHSAVTFCNESGELSGFHVYNTAHLHFTHNIIPNPEIAAPTVPKHLWY